MTKSREPVTIENTLYLVLGKLTIEHAAEVTGRSESYLRALSDPDKRERLTVEDAIKLDLAHLANGGKGRPFYETIGLLIDAGDEARSSDAAAIGAHAIDVARENGEACEALLKAALASGDRELLRNALRQTEDVHRVSAETIATIRGQLARARDGPAQPDTS